jgi:PAS domain S-box-containing protein/putative nucleotidyltransferase with HDIG domain
MPEHSYHLELPPAGHVQRPPDLFPGAAPSLEERFDLMIRNLNDIIAIVDDRGLVRYVSGSAEKTTGYSVREMIGRNAFDFLHPDDVAHVTAALLDLLSHPGKTGRAEYRRRHRDGHWLHMETLATNCLDDPHIRGILLNIRDITERKLYEKALADSEVKFRQIVENAVEGIFQSTPGGRFLSVNPALARMCGYDSPQEMIAAVHDMAAQHYVHPEERETFMRLLRENGRVENFEHKTLRRDGTSFWSSVSAREVRDEQGRLLYYEGTHEDIDKRKRAEEARRESERRLADIIDFLPDATFAVDARGCVIAWNRAIEEMTGVPKEEMIGKGDYEYALPFYGRRRPILIDFIFRWDEDIRKQYSFINKDGEILTTETSVPMVKGQARILWGKAAPLYDARGRIAGAIESIRDITERKEAEERLNEVVANMRKAIATTIQVMIATIERRDPYTAGHQKRTADLGMHIAREMGLPPEQVEGIRIVGSIHDIGKISTPAEILTKPTRLTEIEYALVRHHAVSGFEILKDIEAPWPLAEIVYQHHERLDGSGYPRGLRGEEILLEARILAVADVVESMSSHRPYRPALGREAALAEVRAHRGTRYDPAVVDACLRLFREQGYRFLD